MNRWSPYLLSILRILAAFVYMVHGTQKLFGFPAPFPMPHLPPLFLAGGETFGGPLLLIGLFTRPILSGEMAVAYFKVPRTAGILAAGERRRRRGALLLHVPLFREHEWRTVEL
jgi:putative oxidoreductase